jgi:hypothetical protein
MSLPGAEKQKQTKSESQPAFAEKVHHILEACQNNNLDALVELATTEGGLVHEEVRQTACKP